MAVIITLLILGALLMFLETILPGIVIGIMGLLCLIAAVVIGYNEFDVRTGNMILAAVAVELSLGLFVWLKFFPDSRFAKRFISKGAVGELGVEKPELLNCSGIALTPLRPSGTASIDGKRVDVVTEGGHVDRGQAVKVVAVEGLRVVVRAV